MNTRRVVRASEIQGHITSHVLLADGNLNPTLYQRTIPICGKNERKRKRTFFPLQGSLSCNIHNGFHFHSNLVKMKANVRGTVKYDLPGINTHQGMH